MKIKTTAKEINEQFKEAFKRKTNDFKGIAKNIKDTQAIIKDYLVSKFMNTEEYIQLTAPEGILRGEFGLTETVVSRMPKIVRNMFYVYYDNHVTLAESFNDSGSNKILKFSFDIGDTSYDDIDFSIGELTVETNEGELFVIEWLKWLLFRGEDIIVPDYSVSFIRGAGRSGIAIMVGPEDGLSYSIDGYFAGTAKSNWISRTIKNNAQEIASIIKQNIKIKQSR